MTLRAVIYARCSTEEESQKNALVNQVAEAKACVQKKGWILVDSYVESKSGTSTKGRLQYSRLFEDLQRDKFDIIVIKSQDRLMRNTKDWYLFIDRLVTNQKKLYMYIDHKFYTTDDALITGIKAILAEDYSRELSKKINNAHGNRQKNNGAVVLTSNTYGYNKNPDKSVSINEDEAKMVKRIFELCAAGYGSRSIANVLVNEGYKNRKGKDIHESSIRRIIHNPLYKGTVVMNRQHFDFETKRTIKNSADELIVYDNKVPAIISEELWEKANQEIQKRSNPLKHNKGGYKRQSPLSGKLYCGLCGEPYYRRTRRRSNDKVQLYSWQCKKYLERGRVKGTCDRPELRAVTLEKENGCNNVHLEESVLFQFLEKVMHENYEMDKEKIIREMVDMLKFVLQEKDLQPEIDREISNKKKIQEQMNLLVDKLLEGILTDNTYQMKQKELDQKLDDIQEKINDLTRRKAQTSTLKNRIQHIENRLRSSNTIEQATVGSMLDDIEKILIYPEYMEIYFSVTKMTGIEINDAVNELDNIIRISYGSLFNYRQQKKEGRNEVIELMRDNPKITVKMIGEKLNLSVAGVSYRIKVLKENGKIRYEGKGGKGEWVICEDEKS